MRSVSVSGEVNHPDVFELRPDKLLIDPNFQGYKLSLESLPSYDVPLPSDLDHATATDEQYTLQHVKLAALTNHILPDPWNPACVYIVDSEWNLYKASTSGEKIGVLSKVWSIPDSPLKKPGRFNTTLAFPDGNHAVFADGCGMIYVLETGPRTSEPSSCEWKVLFREQLFPTKKTGQFLVLDSILYQEGQTSFIDVLLLRIDEKSEWKEFLDSHQDTCLSSSTHPVVTVLEWVTFSHDGSKAMEIESSRSLVGRSGVDYAAFEKNGAALYIGSDDPFYFSYDSKNRIEFSCSSAAQAPTVAEENKLEEPSFVKSASVEPPNYDWEQTDDIINLWFIVPDDSSKDDVVVDFSVNDIHVEFKKQVVLTGKLFAAIKPDRSTWTLDGGKVGITLTKDDGQGDKWDGIIAGSIKADNSTQNPEPVDPSVSECSDKFGVDPHNSDVYDPQGLEECDEYPAFTAALMRIDRKEQKITHKAGLDSHQWLFNVRMDPSEAPGISVRHDVDAVIWQPQMAVEKKDPVVSDLDHRLEWNCKHVATFSALGYLQAAKERKKYTLSAPDFSYAVICDDVKHVYVYRQAIPIENDLRNRKTGTQVSHIAKQQVIALEPPLDVMGAYAGPEFLFVLTPKNLHLIRVKGAVDI